MPASRRAVILLSGGLDSTTCLALALAQGFSCYAITVRYGQRHAQELQAAANVARQMGVERHMICDVDLGQFGGSALTGSGPVPRASSVDQIGDDIPVTYVPARNTVFLSLALAWAETLETGDLFIGVNALDYSGYPDCRPEYIEAFERMANLATKAAVEGTLRVTLHTPLLRLTKAEIIARGRSLGVDYGLTTSCYAPGPDGVACGSCDACLLRKRGFQTNGLTDPIDYAPPSNQAN